VKILVTGATGQLGKDVVHFFSNYCTVFGMSREDLDVTELEQCQQKISEIRPDAIIHCAAFTAVDLAESETDQAFKVNAVGSRNVALAAEKIGAKICYLSTDYVFDGTSNSPYNEYDNTNPINVYGKSKRAGEILVQNLSSKFFIVRTSWLYGLYGNNFVKTILRMARKGEQLKVVCDQVGSPTFSEDLAAFLYRLVTTEKYGIYHATNSGACSWYEFAKEIVRLKGLHSEVAPCATDAFPRPALRPNYSVLDHQSIRSNGFSDFRHWRDALELFLEKLDETRFL